ncbi:MAG TPA: hypothetical protein VFV50_05280, partial [Bdellovibrionales bacterium]|nr:hypothetical protein [Bdellovibrionales bacterium]
MFHGIFKFFLLGLLACTSAPAKDQAENKKSEATVEAASQDAKDEKTATGAEIVNKNAAGKKSKGPEIRAAKPGDT